MQMVYVELVLEKRVDWSTVATKYKDALDCCINNIPTRVPALAMRQPLATRSSDNEPQVKRKCSESEDIATESIPLNNRQSIDNNVFKIFAALLANDKFVDVEVVVQKTGNEPTKEHFEAMSSEEDEDMKKMLKENKKQYIEDLIGRMKMFSSTDGEGMHCLMDESHNECISHLEMQLK